MREVYPEAGHRCAAHGFVAPYSATMARVHIDRLRHGRLFFGILLSKRFFKIGFG